MMAYEKIEKEKKKRKKKCLAIHADALHRHKLPIAQALGHPNSFTLCSTMLG